MDERTKRELIDAAVCVAAMLHMFLLALGVAFAVGMIMTMVGWQGDRNTLIRVMLASASIAGFSTAGLIMVYKNRRKRRRRRRSESVMTLVQVRQIRVSGDMGKRIKGR